MIDQIRQPSLVEFMSKLKQNPQKTFQIIEKLGEGTYATVYKAINKITDKLVALKVFPAHTDQYAYLNEIEFLRKIDHPYLVKLYDVYCTPDEVWMVLEYCQLGSIVDLMHTTGKNLSEPEIACICYSVLQALEYIHALHKIHRDVKSANILINSFGQVKLTDFGICSTESSSDSFIGSLLWMAPEMIICNQYDCSVDIWALGICIIEMAEGSAPFSHLHMVRAKYAIQKKPQTQFSNENEFSDDIKSFLDKCLQLSAENRPKASEMLKHPFIEKYKWSMSGIRKKLCQERMQKLEEYRERTLYEKAPGILDEIGHLSHRLEEKEKNHVIHHNIGSVEDLNNHNLSEIEYKPDEQDCHDNHENLTFIEKSSVDGVSDHFHFLESHRSVLEKHPELGHKSQLQFVLKHIQQEKGHENPAINVVEYSPEKQTETQVDPEPTTIQQSTTKAITPIVYRPYATTSQKALAHIKQPVVISENELSCISSEFEKEAQSTSEAAFRYNGSKSEKIDNSPLNLRFSENGKANSAKPMGTKMHKMPNESNFIVKHKGFGMTLDTQADQSIDDDADESILSISSEPKDIDEFEEFGSNTKYNRIYGNNPDLVSRIMVDVRSFGKILPTTSLKERTASTATASKIASHEDSLLRTPGQTPNQSWKQTNIYSNNPHPYSNGMKENMENRNNIIATGNIQRPKVQTDDERLRLEEQMRREMEGIQRKYMSMMKTLETEGEQ